MADLIDRQAAIDALEKEKPTPFVNKDGSIDPFGAGRQNQWYRDGIAIMNLPSAQPDSVPVVHGRWKCVSIGRYACSLCGFEPWYEGSITTLRYCPNCGSRNRSEE